MKKIFLLSSIIILLVSQLKAKDVVPGYIITLNNDTVKCNFEVAGREGAFMDNVFYMENQTQIKQVDSTGKIVKLNPYQIRGYTLIYGQEQGDTLNYATIQYGYEESPGKIIKEKYFLKREIKGFLKLYRYYYKVLTSTVFTYKIVSSYVVQKGNEVIRSDYSSFSKYFKKYFSDYPELSDKIANKIYKSSDMFLIVNEYNSWYKERIKFKVLSSS